MLLIITGVGDATIDVLVDHLNENFFRLNLDDHSSYEFEFDIDGWTIRNPIGLEISSKTATRCLWWKLFMYQLNPDPYVKEEIKVIAQNLFSWFLARNLIVGNPPWIESQFGKLRQATIASKYFRVPQQTIGWGTEFITSAVRQFDGKRVVVKSLASELTETGKAVFTTEVPIERLDPKLPWYLQALVDSEVDITVQIVGEEYFAFSRDRSGLTSLDWRREQFSDPTPWQLYELSQEERTSLKGFQESMGIYWGRADFLIQDNELVFLEINPNGQWAFLDPTNTTGLLSAVANYIQSGKTT